MSGSEGVGRLAGKTQESQKTRYLLGGESEAENERIEAEFFADDDLFQELLTAEDDLIDAYARGELSASERREFERRFLKSSESRERVHFARVFTDASGSRTGAVASPVIPPAPPGFLASIFASAMARSAFAMIAVAALVGFPWLLVERSRMSGELNTLRAEREQLNQQAQELQRAADVEKSKNAETLAQLKTLQEQVAAGANQNQGTSPLPTLPRRTPAIDNNETIARNDPPVQDTVGFDVDPGSTRGGGGNTFTVRRNVKAISLRLGLEAESSHQEYRAVIETAEGRRVKSVDFKVANVPHDRVAVPAVSTRELRAGDYILLLTGKKADGSFERIASYSFRIVDR